MLMKNSFSGRTPVGVAGDSRTTDGTVRRGILRLSKRNTLLPSIVET
jgi:hypothetical protein